MRRILRSISGSRVCRNGDNRGRNKRDCVSGENDRLIPSGIYTCDTVGSLPGKMLPPFGVCPINHHHVSSACKISAMPLRCAPPYSSQKVGSLKRTINAAGRLPSSFPSDALSYIQNGNDAQFEGQCSERFPGPDSQAHLAQQDQSFITSNRPPTSHARVRLG